MSYGERLKEERKRLKIKQKDLAVMFNVVHQTILGYEKGTRSPGLEFLEKLAPLGFDVQYIITGVRSENSLTTEEKEIISFYRSAPDTIKQAVKAVLTSGESGTVKTVHFGRNNNLQNSKIKISQ